MLWNHTYHDTGFYPHPITLQTCFKLVLKASLKISIPKKSNLWLEKCPCLVPQTVLIKAPSTWSSGFFHNKMSIPSFQSLGDNETLACLYIQAHSLTLRWVLAAEKSSPPLLSPFLQLEVLFSRQPLVKPMFSHLISYWWCSCFHQLLNL